MILLTIYMLFFYRYRFSISAARLQLHSGKQGTIYHWTAMNEQLYLATKSNSKPWSKWTRERISVFWFTDINGGHCYNALCNYMHCEKKNYQKKRAVLYDNKKTKMTNFRLGSAWVRRLSHVDLVNGLVLQGKYKIRSISPKGGFVSPRDWAIPTNPCFR